MDGRGGEFDLARAARFERRMLELLNGGALAVMTSIGHRTGLFEVLRRLPAADLATIAARAGLAEPYVREWLAAMVAGGFVDYDPAAGRYRLPPEHAAVLTRDARPNNLAVVARWIPLLGALEDELVACSAGGSALSRAAKERIDDVASEVGDQIVAARLLDGIVPLASGLREALTSGLDVLELGSGDGRNLAELARAYPKSRFTGWEPAPEAVDAAQDDAARARLGNVRYVLRDPWEAPHAPGFDLVLAFDVLHEQPRPRGVLAAAAAALRPGALLVLGAYVGTSCLERDAAHPLAPLLYAVACLRAGLAEERRGEADASIGMMAGEAVVRRLLGEAGFVGVEARTVRPDDCHLFYLARKAR